MPSTLTRWVNLSCNQKIQRNKKIQVCKFQVLILFTWGLKYFIWKPPAISGIPVSLCLWLHCVHSWLSRLRPGLGLSGWGSQSPATTVIYRCFVLQTAFRGYKKEISKIKFSFVNPERPKAQSNKNGINLMIFN